MGIKTNQGCHFFFFNFILFYLKKIYHIVETIGHNTFVSGRTKAKLLKKIEKLTRWKRKKRFSSNYIFENR